MLAVDLAGGPTGEGMNRKLAILASILSLALVACNRNEKDDSGDFGDLVTATLLMENDPPNPQVEFEGTWESCLSQSYQLIVQETTTTGVFETTPQRRVVAGCQEVVLNLNFYRTQLDGSRTPTSGCLTVDFTSGKSGTMQQCGISIQMKFDLK
jgi:hypothetical protein